MREVKGGEGGKVVGSMAGSRLAVDEATGQVWRGEDEVDGGPGVVGVR